MKTVLQLLFIVLCTIQLNAQMEEDRWHYGFKAGTNLSLLGDVQQTIIRPIHPIESYSTSTERSLGYTVGFYLYYKFKKSKFAFLPELEVSSQGGKFNYSDVRELNYQMEFRYAYFSLSPKVKAYLFGGLNLTFGPRLSFNLDRNNLKYTSNMPELGPDLQVQQSLREVLKGNNLFAISVGAGYDFPFGLNVAFSYDVGIIDGLETLANGFFFIENTNATSAMHVTVGYSIPFF